MNTHVLDLCTEGVKKIITLLSSGDVDSLLASKHSIVGEVHPVPICSSIQCAREPSRQIFLL